jgi:histidinol phosphatase-like enzyme (inositol monophosphatase family)
MQELVEFAAHLAEQSGHVIMRYFGTGVQVLEKPDQSPVTVADREAEALMRRLIEARYPGHRVLGEEGGESGQPGSDFQWVLDPIDGTRPFVHGVPLFGTLIGLLERGQPVLGAIHLPVSKELMIGAKGRATTLNGRPVRVRNTERLSEATLVYTSTQVLWQHGHGAGFERLQERVALARGWGDCYGHFMVAAGRADIMIDPEMKLWDVAALKPCVDGAGGRLTDKFGKDTGVGQSAVSTNGRLHQQVLDILHGRA